MKKESDLELTKFFFTGFNLCLVIVPVLGYLFYDWHWAIMAVCTTLAVGIDALGEDDGWDGPLG